MSIIEDVSLRRRQGNEINNYRCNVPGLRAQLVLEYSDQLQDLVNNFSIKFSKPLLEALTQLLLEQESSKVLLHFIDGLSVDFKENLLRNFITTCEEIREYYLPVLEVLITPQVEFDTIRKLIEILSNGKIDLSMNKPFGKLLMNMITLLGKNVLLVEQPLKYIISSHRSIWRSKLSKKLEDFLQNSSMLSQSVRY